LLTLQGSAGQLTLRLRSRASSLPLLKAFGIAIALHLAAYLLLDLHTPLLTDPSPRPPAFVSADPGVTIQITGTEAAPLVDPTGLLPRHVPVPDIPYPQLPALPQTSLASELPLPTPTRPTFTQLDSLTEFPSRALFFKTYTPLVLELSHELAHLKLLDAPDPTTMTTTDSLHHHLIRYRLTVDPRHGTVLRTHPLDPVPADLTSELDTLLTALHFAPTDALEPLLVGTLEVHITQ
jgi:hypothetical protein